MNGFLRGFLGVLGLPVLFCLLEIFLPDKKLKPIPGYYYRVLSLNTLQLGVVLLGGVTWEKWLQEFTPKSVFQWNEIPWVQNNVFSAAFLAYLISVPLFGSWHRIRHESQFLWRTLHQLHHSPSTFAALMAFYKHPLEMITDSIIMSILLYPILGLTAEYSVWWSFFASFAEWIYHSNLYFPWWCDYVFQTPRNHRIHHFRNSQNMGKNFSDIPWLYDMWVGTFEPGCKPKLSKYQEDRVIVGFEVENEKKIWEMLCFQDLLHANRSWFYFNTLAYKITFLEWKSFFCGKR